MVSNREAAQLAGTHFGVAAGCELDTSTAAGTHTGVAAGCELDASTAT